MLADSAERSDERLERTAWLAVTLANTVGRELRMPVSMATLVPELWQRREALRERLRAEREAAERNLGASA